MFEMRRSDGPDARRAFTITELVITVVLISMIAAFGVPNYQKAVQRARERKAVLNLRAIYAANKIYHAQNGEYYIGAGLNLAGINAALSIDISDPDMTYSYTGVNTGQSYTATAAWTGGGNFTVRISEIPILLAARPDSHMGDVVQVAWARSAGFIEFVSDRLVPPAHAVASGGGPPYNPCCVSGSCPTLPGCN